MLRNLAIGVLVLGVAACTTMSAKPRIEDGLMSLGFSQDRAGCLADDLENRLEADDLNNVADFVQSLSAASTPGEGIDALMTIDNPTAAQAIARAAIACAF